MPEDGDMEFAAAVDALAVSILACLHATGVYSTVIVGTYILVLVSITYYYLGICTLRCSLPRLHLPTGNPTFVQLQDIDALTMGLDVGLEL